MESLQDWLAFSRTVELGSFAAAGRSLEQTASAVGKQVARLEKFLGVRLLQRSTRRMTLTPEGRLAHLRCHELLLGFGSLRAELACSVGAVAGPLRVGAPWVAQHWLVPLLPAFLQRHPGVQVDLHFSDEQGDLLSDGLDLAIRSVVPPDAPWQARPLQAFRLQLWAAPSYLARSGRPQGVADLKAHRALRFRHPDSGKLLPWPFLADEARVPPTALSSNQMEAIRQACLQGLGLACMPDFQVREDLQTGRLEPVLAQELVHLGRYQALWLRGVPVAPRVRAFIEHLAAAAGKGGGRPPPKAR
ncbi:LysR substrate-binding domain-containing protein [Inhella proteolytica]|uniref:LysR family transcriptional regulator n=1 Tax=Inhella proteolytica TaxID=2795029 RepID=A0A931J4C4_9BURK|nr:LysR substrate-binding domain-containing protein [Inhella proteolytica]MBH9578513.1 LysR family transcriptional regulator [Inhella proteolytica]